MAQRIPPAAPCLAGSRELSSVPAVPAVQCWQPSPTANPCAVCPLTKPPSQNLPYFSFFGHAQRWSRLK